MINNEAQKLLKKLPTLLSFADLIQESDSGIKKITTFTGASKNLFIAHIFEKRDTILLLYPEQQLLLESAVELALLGLESYLIPITEITEEALQERITTISQRKKAIILAEYSTLFLPFPSKNTLKKDLLSINLEGEIGYKNLLDLFGEYAYQREQFVEQPGTFAVRGAIVDVWSYSERSPVRIEFDGDFVESLRYFDPDSQRSVTTITHCTIAPKVVESQETSQLIEYLNNPLVIASIEELRAITPPQPIQSIHEAIVEPKISEKELENLYLEEFPEPDLEKIGVNTKETIGLQIEDIEKLSVTFPSLWLLEHRLHGDGVEDLFLRSAPTIHSNYERLFNAIIEHKEQGFKTLIAVENNFQAERFSDLLAEYKSELATCIDEGMLSVVNLPVKEGFKSLPEKLLLLTDYQIFNKPYRTKISSSVLKKKPRNKEFASIKNGDYVVHEQYGVARYGGLATIKIGDVDQESMKLIFDKGGIVYVNLSYLHLVKKFSSKEGFTPHLTELGTNEWTNTTKKTKKKIVEMARELITLYAKRRSAPGYPFNADTVWQRELEQSFIYEATPDQVKATDDIKQDMMANYPMDRLVVGDVGFGKTEVAVRAAFKAIQEGKQAAVLVPTTILAEQHFNTFRDRLSQFPVTVEVMSRFQTKQKQKEIVETLAQGKTDIVIGTHRLISKDVVFKDLGILIIDEEHRFGVMAKEKLRQIKENVDTLTLTATPIPRTLNMSLLGARDLSIIATPPLNRQPIVTRVIEFDVYKIKQIITTELLRHGQVYIVHDRINSIDRLAGYISKYVPEARIAIAHGRVKPQLLEEIIHNFSQKKFDILISTKIIESGIDIPNVNTIIVNRADRFGLAELHQLRGRVGRSDRQAYAYFLVPSLQGLTAITTKRLQAIEENSDIGSGFNIAMRDLEIRGAGNLLGTQQSGFIDEVGFDLYIKMINEAVEELKREEFKDVFTNLPKQELRTDPTIDAHFEIGIPTAYMPDQIDRLGFYTSVLQVASMPELMDIREELKDRFGSLPITVKRLIGIAQLKYYSSRALFDRVIIRKDQTTILLPKGKHEEYYQNAFQLLLGHLMEKHRDRVQFQQQQDTLRLVIKNLFAQPEGQLKFVIGFAKEIAVLFNTIDGKEETPLFDSDH